MFFLFSLVPLQAQEESCFFLKTSSVIAEPGETVCVDVTVGDFENILGIQYTQTWDPTVLKFIELRNFNLPDLGESVFGLPSQHRREGIITLSWFNLTLTGVTIPNGTPIYSICFEVIGEIGSSSPIRFSDIPTAREVVNIDEAVVYNPAFISGNILVSMAEEASLIEITGSCITAIDCNENSGSINVNIAGGTPPFRYYWEGPNGFTSEEEDITGLSPGRYSLTVTDQYNTEATTSFLLSLPRSLAHINANIINPICDQGNGSIILNLPEPENLYTFSWSTGSTSKDATNLPIGEYTVTVTDLTTGCSNSETYVLNAEEGIIAVSYNCGSVGDSSTAYVSAIAWQGGIPPYTFSWSTGDVTTDSQTSVISVPGVGLYTVTITDQSGCSIVSDPILVDCSYTPDKFLTLNSSPIAVSPGEEFCVDIRVLDFRDIIGLHFLMKWDSSVIRLQSIENFVLPGSAEDNFFQFYPGDLAVGWRDQTVDGVNLPNGTSLFQLCFKASDEPGSTSLENYSSLNGFEVTYGDNQTGRIINTLGEIFVLDQSNTAPFVPYATNKTANFGDQVCVDVKANNFNNIAGMQFSMGWDPAMLDYNSILPGTIDFNNFEFNSPEERGNGLLRTVWLGMNGEGQFFPDSTTLFQICYDVVGQIGIVPVEFKNNPIPVQIADGQLNEVPFETLSGSVIITNDPVWPGDSDNNGRVNHYDLLNIGVAYGARGLLRTNATTNWNAEAANNWRQLTDGSNINFKHIDTDGNGLINALDTNAIVGNWGKENENKSDTDLSPILPRGGAPIYLLPDTVQLGEKAHFSIVLGEELSPAHEIYGLAFTILYDPNSIVPGSASAKFEESWLGELGINMIGIYRDYPEEGRIEMAVTRIDGRSIHGSGIIGTLKLTIEDVIFPRSTTRELPLDIERVRMINSLEEELPISPVETISLIETEVTDTHNEILQKRIRLFPNPAQDKVNLITENLQVDRFTITNIQGQTLRKYNAVNSFSISDLANGTYFVEIKTTEGVVRKKLVIVR